MDKEVVVYINNGILLSHKRNAFESVLMRWLNLESIIQSGVRKRKINSSIKKWAKWYFPDGPAAKTPSSQCSGAQT